MDVINEIASLVTNVGFPIVACGACFWMINKQDERHKEELTLLNQSLNNNTIAINNLATKIGVDEN